MLKQVTEKDRESTIEQAKELSQKGYSQRQISNELGISLGAVNKYLKIIIHLVTISNELK